MNAMGLEEAGLSLALRFLNTDLDTPAAVLAWLEGERLLGGPAGATRPAEARILLDETRRLRADIGRALEAHRVRRRVPAPSLHGINRALEAGPTLSRVEAGPDRVELVVRRGGSGPLAALAPVALAAARLMAAVEPSRIRRCPAPGCAAWFVDTSKGGKRKWCSMARCGNRAKAATHRARRSEP